MPCLSLRGGETTDVNVCSSEPNEAGPLLLRAYSFGTINLEVMDSFELWFVLGLNVQCS